MGVIIKADFKTRLNSKLQKFDPRNSRREYHQEIFKELFAGFPQFKAHVAMYVERNYCFVVNDEDHSRPESLLVILKPEEVRFLNEWITNKGKRFSSSSR
ncbi:MAG: hypothetical protein ACE5EK_11410 [Nitrospinales bacterium]